MLTQQIYKPMGRPSSTRRWAARRWTNRLRLIMFGVTVAVAVALTGALGSHPAGLHLVTIPAGTELVAVLDRTLSTASTGNRQTVFLETREPVRVDSALTLPAGLLLRGQVSHPSGTGNTAAATGLTIQFTEMEVGGLSYRIAAKPFQTRAANDALRLPVGQVLRIRLLEPVTVEYPRGPGR
jgi:hypothetical protein